MANNPYINKVVYNNQTLIDLTSDTVDAAHLAQGYTAHNLAGQKITGTMSSSSGTFTETWIDYRSSFNALSDRTGSTISDVETKLSNGGLVKALNLTNYGVNSTFSNIKYMELIPIQIYKISSYYSAYYETTWYMRILFDKSSNVATIQRLIPLYLEPISDSSTAQKNVSYSDSSRVSLTKSISLMNASNFTGLYTWSGHWQSSSWVYDISNCYFGMVHIVKVG